MKQLEPSKLFAGRKKILQNAIDLSKDAEVLFEAARYARAFYLIQIATEELGKYGITTTSAISALHGSLDWKRYWRRFRDHKNKTEHLLLLEDLRHFISGKKDNILNMEENAMYSAMQEDVKMKSLYSDIGDSEEFLLPSEIINKELCEIALRLLKNRLELVTSFESDVASKFDFDKLKSSDIEHFYEKYGFSKILKRKEEG
jgi:AbiV family abortive infection protein